jgi:hypothetical protein
MRIFAEEKTVLVDHPRLQCVRAAPSPVAEVPVYVWTLVSAPGECAERSVPYGSSYLFGGRTALPSDARAPPVYMVKTRIYELLIPVVYRKYALFELRIHRKCQSVGSPPVNDPGCAI